MFFPFPAPHPCLRGSSAGWSEKDCCRHLAWGWLRAVAVQLQSGAGCFRCSASSSPGTAASALPRCHSRSEPPLYLILYSSLLGLSRSHPSVELCCGATRVREVVWFRLVHVPPAVMGNLPVTHSVSGLSLCLFGSKQAGVHTRCKCSPGFPRASC